MSIPFILCGNLSQIAMLQMEKLTAAVKKQPERMTEHAVADLTHAELKMQACPCSFVLVSCRHLAMPACAGLELQQELADAEWLSAGSLPKSFRSVARLSSAHLCRIAKERNQSQVACIDIGRSACLAVWLAMVLVSMQCLASR